MSSLIRPTVIRSHEHSAPRITGRPLNSSPVSTQFLGMYGLALMVAALSGWWLTRLITARVAPTGAHVGATHACAASGRADPYAPVSPEMGAT